MFRSTLPQKVVLVTSVLSLSSLVYSKPFGTVNGILGQHNEHEMITRVAFQCATGQKSNGDCFEPISLDNLAGTHVGSIPGLGDNGMVGSPDDLPPEGPSAHCDDADFLDIASYPRTRAQATAQLQSCVDHLRMRFGQAVRGTSRMLNATNKAILRSMTHLSSDECDHGHRETTDNTDDKAKCVALEGFGRALHGIQDFYSHSNWADLPNPNISISVTNPPGLNRADSAPFFDLRLTGSIAAEVPQQLSTGCYTLFDRAVGRGDCTNRVTHYTINKDHGIITLTGGITADADDVPRNEVSGNFVRAVNAAVADSRRQWGFWREAIRAQYGVVEGNRMICGLVSDNAAVDCV
ncbi:CinY protein [Dendryphion nanum]|uniref:CinY protein n=1 Tax=Dendryphion nanum TaxID=256645 RepID=A0A9P9ISM3_9PLEO|nr:CinY protein [Dendryphion nanum]